MPAPTAAEVAADPARYAGTSFDPARSITPTIVLIRQAEAAAEASAGRVVESSGWTPTRQAEWERQFQTPPQGSRATNDPNVFVLASGATWNRPGTIPVHATTESYDAWQRQVFGGL